MGERFFEDGNAMDSLRSSDFDAYSAYGEVIDNAIQADATEIKIKFDVTITGKSRPINVLAFGDNGSGMDTETLASCLKLGWSSRFNDRSGIGRFGVGMVLGGIHECKRIEVYSKQKENSNWFWTYVDLDEITNNEMTEIPTPVARKLPAKYADMTFPEHGTLVLWSKYDRQKGSADKIIKEAHDYIGQTFRKFIWQDIKITIDGQIVKAHDPLYLVTDKTRFPDDPVGKEYDAFTIPWPIKDKSLHAKFGEESQVKIRMSLLPEEFRPVQGSGGSEHAKIRKINDDQEGVSILREGREVFSGPIPRWNSVKTGHSNQRTWKFDDLDRWWGCEISFGAELDSSFEVKNIKRGARPEDELLAAIKEKITPTRNSVLEEVRDVWKKAKDTKRAEEEKKADEVNRHASHEKVEKAAAGAISTHSKFDPNKSTEEAGDEHFAKFDMENEQTQRYKEYFKEQPYTIVDDHKGWRGGSFWEVTMAGDKILMQYNLPHDFFVQLRNLEQLISNEPDINKLKNHSLKITALVDLLLISFAKTQAGFEKEQTVLVEDLVEMLRDNWGQNLKSFVKAWVRAEDGDDND